MSGQGSAMQTTSDNNDPQLLANSMKSFYNTRVDYDQKLMTENKKLVKSFISDFKEFLVGNVQDLPLSVGGIEEQGSAFEGLKCGAPDEFDFAIQLKVKKKTGDFVYIEGRTLGATLPDPEHVAGYYKIELKTTEQDKVNAWTKLTDVWPGGKKPCLSPRKVVQRVQSAVDKFAKPDGPAVLAGAGATAERAYWRGRVRGIVRRPKGNPALTVCLTKLDGVMVDVDISPCMIDANERHYVPKRHPKLKGQGINPSDPYELLWMKTESQKELVKISSIDQDGGERRKCMRVLKAALASKDTPFKQFHSSYIVKTAWLHIVDKYPSKDKWKGWELLALRLRDVLEKLEVSFRERRLISRFNKDENVLGRFDDPFLVSCMGYLYSLNNKLRNGMISKFITDLGLQ